MMRFSIRNCLLSMTLVLLLVWPAPAHAPVPLSSTEAGRRAIESTEELYNRLPSPQFRYYLVSQEARIRNGVGTGEVVEGAGSDNPYFCSGQDEANAYRLANGEEVAAETGPNRGVVGNKGVYRVFRIEDRCRTEGGCGDIVPDGKSFILGYPLHATNCHPVGKKAFWEEASSAPAGMPPLAIRRDRSMIDDRGFVYGRYLLEQGGVDLLERSQFGLTISVRANRYHLDSPTPHFLDIPYSKAHLEDGFTCAEGCKAGAYKNPLIDCTGSPSGRNAPIDAEFLEHYRMLAEFFEKGLHNEIAGGDFGGVWQQGDSLTVDQKKRRETVVNVWVIMKEMFEKISWEQRTRWQRIADRARGRQVIEIYECTGVPRSALVEYREGKICFRSGLAATCDAKRSMGSQPRYNTSGRHEGGRCYPSYGELRGRRRDRLVERAWGTEQGYRLSPQTASSETESVSWIGASPGGWVSVDGHAPYYFSLMVHQLVHAYYQQELGQNRMGGFPQSHDALWEEELAVMAQALALSLLQNHGFAPVDFGMEKEEFIRSVETESFVSPTGSRENRVVGATPGARYKYPRIPRGHGEVFLGPFFVNMRNIYNTLKEGNVDLARMMALLHSMGPMQDPPPNICLNGRCGEFSLPEVGRRGPYLEERPAGVRRPVPAGRERIQRGSGR